VDGEGRFVIPALPRGREYELSRIATGFGVAPRLAGLTADGFARISRRIKASDTLADHYECPAFVLK
jgi:hypothetical protein